MRRSVRTAAELRPEFLGLFAGVEPEKAIMQSVQASRRATTCWPWKSPGCMARNFMLVLERVVQQSVASGGALNRNGKSGLSMKMPVLPALQAIALVM